MAFFFMKCISCLQLIEYGYMCLNEPEEWRNMYMDRTRHWFEKLVHMWDIKYNAII